MLGGGGGVERRAPPSLEAMSACSLRQDGKHRPGRVQRDAACGAIEGQGPHIEEFFAPNALKSVMPVLKGTSTSQDVALYLPQY